MSVQRYRLLYKKAFAAAGLPASHPHRLRHGGASMDGMASASNSDLDIMQRGGWATLSSVARYRKPAKYLRRLRELSDQQRAAAIGAPARILSVLKRFVA